ncbi:helix-hairpin-helix domain-containing protein [Lysinibacillus sp. CD3-6]|uniref:helix-hairpin-helix domain-containing protein n=2 Tax=Bacillati TaxID=1783272 RepID=UPI00116C8975|nr:helix-hairpin-helix domain-containing protein [Lysinibacillus sp. CD3-6]UED79012.1 helix-hairpin-helix domain-containing protein [Lysinibacillus sp. CD3-6]
MIQSLWQKYKKSMLLPSILGISGLCYFFFSSFDSSPPQEELIETIQPTEQLALTEPAEEEAVLQQVVIDIKGAVLHPGVYTLNPEQRIIDAVQLAGGYSEDADPTLINHAQKVQDEMVIYIPVQGEQLDETMASFNFANLAAESHTSTSNKVNVNKADNTELTTLAGIGPSKAQSIIAYREENGGFQTIEDIKKVTGIGEKTFEKLKDSITVN